MEEVEAELKELVDAGKGETSEAEEKRDEYNRYLSLIDDLDMENDDGDDTDESGMESGENMEENEREGLLQEFEEMDTDHTGRIHMNDFKDSLGVESGDERDEIIDNAANSDDAVDYKGLLNKLFPST